MPSEVENPFDTQQAQPKPPAGLISGQALSSSPPALNTMPAYQAETPQVQQSTETTQGQLTSILSGDSPLMQRARTIAAQQSNARGLLNSSMAAEAGTAAMIDRATPIANADASVYDTRARTNSDAKNQSLALGANIASQMNLQKSQQDFTAGESSLDRASQADLQSNQFKFQGEQSGLDRSQQTALQQSQQAFQGGESALDRSQQTALQQSQQQFQGTQADIDRAQQVKLQNLQQGFQGDQASLDRVQQLTIAQQQIDAQREQLATQQEFQGTQAGLDRANQLDLAQKQIDAQVAQLEVTQKFQTIQSQLDRDQAIEITKLQASLQQTVNEKNLPQQFAMQTAQSAQNAIEQILGNGDLTPDAKRGAISNLIAAANAQLQWGSTFYNTTLPALKEPGKTSTTENPNPLAPAIISRPIK